MLNRKEINLKQSDLISQIEETVRLRQPVRAHERITRLLQVGSSSPQLLLQACEWYRRLGLYQRGLAVLELRENYDSNVSLKNFEGKKILWAARFLNSMGASNFALKIIQRLEPIESSDFKIFGAIYLSNYRYKEALQSLTKMKDLDQERDGYSSRLAQVSLADAMAGLGNFQSAIDCAQDVLSRSNERILQAICIQAKGEYLAAAGNYSKAFKHLKRAEKISLENDTTTDKGYLFKWIAYCYAKLGNERAARKYFRIAEKNLFQPWLRPEVWLETLRLKDEVGLLPKTESERVYFYPGASEAFRKQMTHRKEAIFGKNKSRILVDFTRDEYKIDTKIYLKIPLEMKLIGYLAIVGCRGLLKIRAKNVLWPDEPFAFMSLRARLDQLIARIRKRYHLSIDCIDETLVFSRESFTQVCVLAGDHQCPSFLEKVESFSSPDFASYYNLKKTQAAVALELWVAEGVVSKSGRGRTTTYSRPGDGV